MNKKNFIKHIIDQDLKDGKHEGRVRTRFAPEPNGYLHIGHLKSICLNFGIAHEYEGLCHLRFDDTNPENEREDFVQAIKKDLKWLNFQWGEKAFYSSNYFEELYRLAVVLIKKNKAYICELDQETQRIYRGSLNQPGKKSPFRDRSIEDNLQLFAEMKQGSFKQGTYVLRAKIDMAADNMHMRDPVLYRIKDHSHPQTQRSWWIYPLYDFSHCLSDSIEKISHSLCTLEFEEHRPFYNWLLNQTNRECHPQQIEFARLNIEYMTLSKRKLELLIDKKIVLTWDDPRLPTIAGMRTRGYLPSSLIRFCENIGVTKKDTLISSKKFNLYIREDLSEICPRVLAVIDPLEVEITNWKEDEIQWITCPYHPKNLKMGRREVPFGRKIFIEQKDFLENPPDNFFRLTLHGSVRLKYGYVITCREVIKDQSGKIIKLKCEYNKDTYRGVTPKTMQRVRGIINWVESGRAYLSKVALYDHLFTIPEMNLEKNFLDKINPDSLTIVDSMMEYSLKTAKIGERFQFERQGYFQVSEKDQNFDFHRIITLKDKR